MNLKQQQAQTSRQNFIRSAISLIEEKGYNGMTVQDICEKTGKSIGAFYHHFSSKEDVIIAAYKEFDDFLQESYRLEGFDRWDQAVAYLLDAYLDYACNNGLEFARATIIAQLSIKNAYITDHSRLFYHCMAQAIARGKIEGALPQAADPDSLCDWFMRTVRGSIFAWVLQDGRPSLAETGRNDYRAVFHMLEADCGHETGD